jgi:lipoyl(octanoyl) transferase
MIQTHYLGRMPYHEAYDKQRELWSRRVAGEIPDQLLLLEHPLVITLGRGAKQEHLLATMECLRSQGVEVTEADRGGDVTYHGPGQLVGYPILNLQPDRMDVIRYLRDLEEVIIQTVGTLGITGERRAGRTGVWVEDRKIAAIGVKISRWVTYHGFALNVSTDLSAFDLIIPCGLRGAKVSSIKKELGWAPPLQEIAAVAAEVLNRIFDRHAHPEMTLEINRA